MSDPSPPPEFLEGVRLFNAGRWYDAHEAWEERWLQMGGRQADLYKGLIQCAVAAMHWERGNPAGAHKLWRTGRRLLAGFAPGTLGLDLPAFLAELEAFFAPLVAARAAGRRPPPPDPARRPRIRLEG